MRTVRASVRTQLCVLASRGAPAAAADRARGTLNATYMKCKKLSVRLKEISRWLLLLTVLRPRGDAGLESRPSPAAQAVFVSAQRMTEYRTVIVGAGGVGMRLCRQAGPHAQESRGWDTPGPHTLPGKSAITVRFVQGNFVEKVRFRVHCILALTASSMTRLLRIRTENNSRSTAKVVCWT